VVDALPLEPGMRVLEVGCGPGAAAREVVRRLGDGFVLGIDRSPRAVAQALAASRPDVASGRLAFEVAAVEELVLPPGTPPFDLAFAVRVGALDGRHPALQDQALARLADVLTPTARLFVDTGDPLAELPLPR
jgi:SAM-dependent methyltransferase